MLKRRAIALMLLGLLSPKARASFWDSCSGDKDCGEGRCEAQKKGVFSYYFDDSFVDRPSEFAPDKGCYLILQDPTAEDTVSSDRGWSFHSNGLQAEHITVLE
jgi:hypothetical protein